MNTLVQDSYKQLVKRIAELLKSYGFKKRGDTFLRSENENVIVVNFQRSMKSTKNEIIFTVNLGVCSTKLFNYYNAGTNRQPTSETDCHLRLRIGNLLPLEKDTWWSLVEQTKFDDLAKFLESTIQDVVIPYLLRYSSDASLIALWESGEAPGLSEKGRQKHLEELRQLSNALTGVQA